MVRNAYIKLVPASAKENVTIGEIRELLQYYKQITTKTGNQVDWNYQEAAFPYVIHEVEVENGTWLHLSSNHDRYHAIYIGVTEENITDGEGAEHKQPVIQVTLPHTATYGDKGKANEFCKFLGKKLKAELHLFNGRIMYYYPRK